MYDPTRRNRRWAFALRIAGLPYIYSTRADWDLTAAGALWPEGSPTLSVVPCLRHVGTLRERLPPLGGVAQQSAIDVTLTSRGDAPRPPGDPGTVFARLGVRSASAWGLVTGVELTPGDADSREPALPATADPPFRVLLDRAFVPPAGGGPFVVHLGPEALLASGVGGSEDDVAGDPHYVTVTDRAIGGTARRPHVSQADPLDFPILLGPEAVFWRSRRAILLGAEIQGHRLGTPFEIMRGFIEQSPSPSADRLSFVVQLSPLTALLDQAVDQVVGETRLVRGLHWHDDSAADEFVYVEAATEQWGGNARAASPAGSGAIDLVPGDVAAWAAQFDPDADDRDPRAGTVTIPGNPQRQYGVSGTAVEGGGGGDPDQLTLDDGAAPVVEIDARARALGPAPLTGRVRRVRLDVGAGRLLRWPGDPDDDAHSALGLINAALGAETHLGADGAWTRLRMTADSIRPFANIPGRMRGWVARHPEATPRLIPALNDVHDPDAFVFAPPARRLWLPFQWGPGDGNGEPAEVVQGPGGRAHWAGMFARRYAFGVARAWYQKGERWLLVADPIDVSSGEIEVDGPDRLPTRVPVAPAVVEVVVPAIGSPLDGASVYLIRLLDPEALPGFAERLEDDVYTIRSRRPSFTHSGDLILHLLQDAAALGLGPDDIDEDSIRGHGGDPTWIRRWRVPETRDPVSFGELIGGICRLTRSALVMRTDHAGRCRMTRVPVGAENSARIAVTIGEGDWDRDDPPRWDTDDQLINVLELKADLGPDGDGDVDFRYTPRPYTSRTSITLFQESEPETIEAAAAGEIDLRSGRRDITARSILALYDTPRREWTGRVGTYLGLLAHLGATAEVTSRHLRGYGAPGVEPPPVVRGLGVVVERVVDVWGEGTRLVLRHFGVQAAGWNWSMAVEEVVDATTVVVAANRYSAPEHPVTGLPWLDIDAVELGDTVACTPACNQGGAVDRVIVAHDRATRRLTFDGAHGLGVRDWIVPPRYANANTLARRHAFIANAAGLAGGETVLSYG